MPEYVVKRRWAYCFATCKHCIILWVNEAVWTCKAQAPSPPPIGIWPFLWTWEQMVRIANQAKSKMSFWAFWTWKQVSGLALPTKIGIWAFSDFGNKFRNLHPTPAKLEFGLDFGTNFRIDTSSNPPPFLLMIDYFSARAS